MRKRIVLLFATITLALSLGVVALAQGPEGPPGPPSQRGMGTGGNRAQMMNSPKMQLMMLTRSIEQINENAKYKMTSKQAKQVLDILRPLRSKSKLSDDQAKDVNMKLKKVFTARQLNGMTQLRNQSRQGNRGPNGQGPRMGEGRGPAAGGGRGPGMREGGPQMGQGRNGQHRQFDPAAMKDFNPFYANPKIAKDDARAQAQAKRWHDFFASLEKIAKGK